MTLMGLGGFPGDDPLSLDMLGMHGSVYANYAVDEADLLLAFGVRFDDRVTGKVCEFAAHGTIVHIDIDPSEINKIKKCHLAIVSDVKYALAELNKMVEPPADLRRMAPQDRRLEAGRSVRLRPRFRGHPAAARHPRAVPADAGPRRRSSPRAWASTRCGPPSTTSSAGRGAGFPVPGWGRWASACRRRSGAKAAHPDTLVVDIDGDGSLLMNIQEMATCFCEKLPVKVMLLNNMHLGMVVQWEDRFHAANRAHTYLGPIDHPEAIGLGNGITPEERYPDFVAIARGFHGAAATSAEKAELTGALQEMIDSPGRICWTCRCPTRSTCCR